MEMIGLIPHCDEPGCDLGMVVFTCEACKKSSKDFEAWWHQNDAIVLVTCEHCGHKFNMRGLDINE